MYVSNLTTACNVLRLNKTIVMCFAMGAFYIYNLFKISVEIHTKYENKKWNKMKMNIY